MPRKTATKGGRKPKKAKIEPTPSLGYQNIETTPAEPPLTIEKKLEKFRQSQAKSKNWMWLGVFGLSAVIFFFWGWSLISNISLFNWKRTGENTLVKKTQDDWNKIFIETTKKEENKKQIKEKIGVLIEEFKKQTEINTTNTLPTASSTTEISTTTTSTIR